MELAKVGVRTSGLPHPYIRIACLGPWTSSTCRADVFSIIRGSFPEQNCPLQRNALCWVLPGADPWSASAQDVDCWHVAFLTTYSLHLLQIFFLRTNAQNSLWIVLLVILWLEIQVKDVISFLKKIYIEENKFSFKVFVRFLETATVSKIINDQTNFMVGRLSNKWQAGWGLSYCATKYCHARESLSTAFWCTTRPKNWVVGLVVQPEIGFW